MSYGRSLVAAALLAAVLPACGPNCGPEEEVRYCRTGVEGIDATSWWHWKATCCPINAKNCCSQGEAGKSRLTELPRPDLSYATLDGLVDFGTTELKVEMPAEGDSLTAKLKGRVAIAGGVCAQPQCPLQVLLIELQPVQATLTTAKGKHVSGMFVRNANPWKGTRQPDGSLVMDPANELALEALLQGQWQSAILNVNTWFKSAIYSNVTRTGVDGKARVNNLIKVSGSFANKDVKASLTLSIWATSCTPAVHPSAACVPDIEPGRPGHVRLTSAAALLGNLQSSRDLCDTLLVSDPAAACSAGGNSEFPTFSCKEQPVPDPANLAEVARQLKFRWEDADGNVLGVKDPVDLEQLPTFPVRLEVENKWGRVVTGELLQAPQGVTCPKPSGLLAFGVLSGTGQKESGTPNWASSFDAASRRYQIKLSGEDYDFRKYATVVTPSFGTGQGGACSTSSADGKLLVMCHDSTGAPADPAAVSFVTFEKPDGPATGVLAFGVLGGAGSKETGTSNWSATFDAAQQKYEISITGESYDFRKYTTVVTPSFQSGQSGWCTSGSLDGKLVVRCQGTAAPVGVAFAAFSAVKATGTQQPLAFGVVLAAGNKESGTSNWAAAGARQEGRRRQRPGSAAVPAASYRYEITVTGEDYDFRRYTTVVTPSFQSGQNGYCTSGSAGGKLLVECQNGTGQPIAPVSFSFVTYRRP